MRTVSAPLLVDVSLSQVEVGLRTRSPGRLAAFRACLFGLAGSGPSGGGALGMLASMAQLPCG